MAIQTLRRFWKALEQIPGAATDGREWRLLLGEEWPRASRYLRATGDRADAVSCPSPGGDECPRKVIDLGDGRYRAVCQARPPLCDTLDLAVQDVTVLALDRPRLFRDLAAALDSAPSAPARTSGDSVVEIGQHAVVAGISAPVFLVLPDPRDALRETDFRDAGLGRDPAIILLLAANVIPSALRGRFQSDGHEILILSEVVGSGEGRALEPMQPITVLLRRLRAALQVRLNDGGTRPAWPLPPDTQWEQITMRLIADDTMSCSVHGVSRDLDPRFFGMRNAKNDKPAKSWTMLCLLAAGSGRLNVQNRQKIGMIHQRLRLLRQELAGVFGLGGDPLPWIKADQVYVARFVITDERGGRRPGRADRL